MSEPDKGYVEWFLVLKPGSVWFRFLVLLSSNRVPYGSGSISVLGSRYRILDWRETCFRIQCRGCVVSFRIR